MSEQNLDTFICVHHRDVDYLFELVLRSYQINFLPKGRLTLVSNNRAYLQEFIDGLDLNLPITVTSDDDWLSRQELTLPGWFRQQLIKLRAYEFCSSANFCNLGADTILLQPISLSDLVDQEQGLPISYYTRHSLPDAHLLYEWQRLGYISKILQVQPKVTRRYIDFINDLFCFNGELLVSLNRYLEKLYGKEPYYQLLHHMTVTKGNQHKFGEWTLYTMYLLDCLKQPVTLRNSRESFLYQIHSQRNLNRCKFDKKVIHFVGKNFEVPYIKQQIIAQGGELGKYLAHAEPNLIG